MNSVEQVLTDEIRLSSWVTQKFNEARSAKTDLDILNKKCLDAYNGVDLTPPKPDYASNHMSNYIFATIETIRPIMTDNNPRFQALPRTAEGKMISRKIQLALDYEWERERCTTKLNQALLTALQTGTAVIYLPYDKKNKNVKWINVNPSAIFVDPMATSFEDAEYVIYATYKNINVVKELFPNKADRLQGAEVDMHELVNSLPPTPAKNQVLVLEMWCRDNTYIDVEEIVDGQKKNRKVKLFPNGRVITIAPRYMTILSDKKNPYKDGKFPFIALKAYDVPFSFWGKGEVEQLISPQQSMNELNNAIIDNAKHTANTIWVVDKNSGIPHNGLSNRTGLVVRKNPGTEVTRPQPPSMPMYVQQKVSEIKYDMNIISGINEVTMGLTSGGVTAATAIMALQEAGQARIRLKVRIMEQALSELANMWYSRMQQFWIDNREIRIADANGKTDFKSVTPDDLKEDFDIIISAGSTMPQNKNAMLDAMIRLAQTMGEDGLPMVDREALVEYVPMSDKVEMLDRFNQAKQQSQQAMQEQLQNMSENLQQQIQELAKAVQEIAGEVGAMNKQQEGNAKVQREKEVFTKGIQKGMSGNDLTDDEYYDIMQNSKKIPDEVLAEINNLSDDELNELMKLIPNLEEILANNA